MNESLTEVPTRTQLAVPEPTDLRTELDLRDPTAIAVEEADAELVARADELVGRILGVDPADGHAAAAAKASMETMGLSLQEQASHRSAMLKEPLNKMAKRGDEGGEVATALLDLKQTVDELDPSDVDLEPSWFARIFGKIPGIGTPIKRYFNKFESSQAMIDAIMHSLEQGKNQLQHDNVTLQQDQAAMRALSQKLERAVQLGKLIDQKLSYQVERELVNAPDRARFVQEELIFPLRQRIMDLQQQLAVNQQGVVTLEVVMRNNKELIRGVNRATHVTVNALQVAVTLAVALANQKIVLDKVNAVNETTNALIAGTAARLKQQGAEIHKQASSAALDIETLKKAFEDIHAALDDISAYRQKALPAMAKSIDEMTQLTDKGEKRIQDMERAEIAAENVFEIIPEDKA